MNLVTPTNRHALVRSPRRPYGTRDGGTGLSSVGAAEYHAKAAPESVPHNKLAEDVARVRLLALRSEFSVPDRYQSVRSGVVQHQKAIQAIPGRDSDWQFAFFWV
jgi:hypothetical protein